MMSDLKKYYDSHDMKQFYAMLRRYFGSSMVTLW